MLTYFIATRSIDYVVEGLEEYIGVTIMTCFEVRYLRNLVLKYEPNAFIFTNIIKEAAGGVLLKRKSLKLIFLVFKSHHNLFSLMLFNR